MVGRVARSSVGVGAGRIPRARVAERSPGPWLLSLKGLLRDKTAVGFGVLFVLLCAAALAAPIYADEIAHTTPAANHITEQTTVDGKPTDIVSVDGIPIGPTWHGEYFLGADENGRDLMVRLLYGARASLQIGLAALLITLVFAIPLALAAGYFRGRTDALISRLLDVIWSFPALLLGAMLGTAINLRGAQVGPIEIKGGTKLIPIIVIGLVYIPYIARPLRGQVLALREQRFVEAARALGVRPIRLMVSELLPHLWPSILVLSMLLLANAVVLETALSFLGAGVNPPEPSFGTLIADGIENVRLSTHLLIAPCVALVLFVLALSGLAEGLRRALDPHRKLGVDLLRGR
jgi:peptide/nickel transport system permease protein